MKQQLSRCGVIIGVAVLAPSLWSPGQSGYLDRNIESAIPHVGGGGAEALVRAFADVSRKYLKQGVTSPNMPGASGPSDWTEIHTPSAITVRSAVFQPETANESETA